MNRGLDGKVVLITGASAGIGEALARRMAAQGASLLLMARRVERLEALAAELAAGGARVRVHAGDVTRAEDLEAAVAAATREFGRLDIAIANAGFGVAGRFEALTEADYLRQFDTNVLGVLRTLRASRSELLRNRGSFVIMGSVAGYVGLPGSSAYSMSKFAVRAFADAMHGELHPHGVAVTLISPGFITSEIRKIDNAGALHARATDPVPAWIRMDADVAARRMARAIVRRRREVIVTAHGKLIVLIARFAPWIFHLLAARGVRGRPQPEL